MTDFSTRFRLIYVPFLWINLLFIIIYSFLHWIFVIKLELPLNEELVHFWLPFALPWIPIFIWLGPRIKLLILKDKKGNLPFLYRFIAGFAIAIPALIAQDYVETATGRLTVLNDISALNTQSLTKYYELKKHSIDKQHIALYKQVEVTGRYSENYEMFIDVACPILPDTLKPGGEIKVGTPWAWLGIEFKRKISNHLSQDKKNDEWKSFDTVTSADFKTKNLDDFVYLDRIGTNARHKA